MSEQERRWKRRDGGVNWVLRDGALRLHIGTTEMASSQTIEGLEQHPNVIETFDHLPNPIPPPLVNAAEMITALRHFRDEVVQAAQTVSNSKLPHAIFQADDELAQIVPRTKAET